VYFPRPPRTLCWTSSATSPHELTNAQVFLGKTAPLATNIGSLQAGTRWCFSGLGVAAKLTSRYENASAANANRARKDRRYRPVSVA